jgi:hypothetical protein
LLTLWARRYHVSRALAVAAMQLAIWRVIAEPVRIPGRGQNVEWVLSPLVPSLLAMATPDALQVAYEDGEVMSREPVARRRLRVAVVVLAAAVVSAGVGAAGGDRTVALRNSLQLVGIAFWSALLLPPAIAWCPSMLAPLVVWLIGTPDPGDLIPGWAVLLHDQRSIPAALAALLTAGSGVVIYLARTSPLRPFGPRSW